MSHRILVIDDDENALSLLGLLLERRGYTVATAVRAAESLRSIYHFQPDLVLLDVMLPDMDGWQLCRRLRELSDVPIVFLTGRSSISDVITGLEMGADDYIVKPYDHDELLARVYTNLRHSPHQGIAEELQFDGGNFRINLLNRDVWVNNKPVSLTAKEFDLLSILVRHAGRPVNHIDLIREAWGPEYSDTMGSLKLYVHYLRQKIEGDPQCPRFLLTVRGIGYCFAKS